MAMKRAEMGTDLIDHLTPEEKDLLSRLNPEITDLKDKLITCRTDRIEVNQMNSIGVYMSFNLMHLCVLICVCFAFDRLKQGKQSLKPI